MKRLIIAGAGGFGREVYHYAQEHPDCGRAWEVAGFLDDNSKLAALPGPLLGPIEGYAPRPEDIFVCAVGLPAVKRAVVGKLKAAGAQFMKFVHPRAYTGANVQLGEGCVLCPGALLTADIELAEFVTVNCLSSMGHDVRVGPFSTLAGHCDLTGFVRVGADVNFGSGARVIPSRIIGDGATVGAGSVVIRDVPPGVTVFGNPARRL